MDGNSAEFSVMNIEEFLTENEFDFSGRFSPPVEEDESGQRDASPGDSMDGYGYVLFKRLNAM
jgi:hypothetical protein